LNLFGLLIAQFTSANAAQYSVVSFICHIEFPFLLMGFLLMAQRLGGKWQRLLGRLGEWIRR
jgi:hypothetical protein